MTLQELTDKLQTIAHHGHAQSEVYLNICRTTIKPVALEIHTAKTETQEKVLISFEEEK